MIRIYITKIVYLKRVHLKTFFKCYFLLVKSTYLDLKWKVIAGWGVTSAKKLDSVFWIRVEMNRLRTAKTTRSGPVPQIGSNPNQNLNSGSDLKEKTCFCFHSQYNTLFKKNTFFLFLIPNFKSDPAQYTNQDTDPKYWSSNIFPGKNQILIKWRLNLWFRCRGRFTFNANFKHIVEPYDLGEPQKSFF